MKRFFQTIISLLLVLTLLAGTGNCAFSAEEEQPAEQTVEERAEEILQGMTLKEKAAQMVFVSLPAKPKTSQQKYQYGGYVLFAAHFKNSSAKEIKKKIKSWQKVSKVKMLIAVDEEGGSVVRVSKYRQFRSEPFPSPRQLRLGGGTKAVKKDAKEKAELLLSLGINTNYGPVADTPYSKRNYIFSRSYSTYASKNEKFVKAVVNQDNEQSLVSTLKHFPGYGNNGDTHKDEMRDKRSLSTFEERDLKPFQAGIDAGVPMIMINHNIVNAFDKKNPASLSKKVNQYLRNEMGFEGVIITDSLGMTGAKKSYGSNAKVAVKAVKAGNDMLCTIYGPTSVNAIYKAVKNGDISEKRIDDSVRRILIMKLKYGIIE